MSVREILDELPRLDAGERQTVLRRLIEIDPAILEATVSATEKSYAGHKVHRDLGGHARVVEAWS